MLPVKAKVYDQWQEASFNIFLETSLHVHVNFIQTGSQLNLNK